MVSSGHNPNFDSASATDMHAQFKSQVRGMLSKQQQDIGRDMSVSICFVLLTV